VASDEERNQYLIEDLVLADVYLANLPDEVYDDIGRGVRAIARGYRDAYEAAKEGIKV